MIWQLVISSIFAICILSTIATKTEVLLTIPDVCNSKSFDGELEEINVFANIKGILYEHLKGETGKTKEELYDWIVANKDGITLTVKYHTGKDITTANVQPTKSNGPSGNIISYGFSFRFLEMPYPEVYIEQQYIYKSPLGYLKENTRGQGKDTEFIFNPRVTTLGTPIDDGKSFFMVVTIQRKVKVTSLAFAACFEGPFDQKQKQINLMLHQAKVNEAMTLLNINPTLNCSYWLFPMLISPSLTLISIGHATEHSRLHKWLPLNIRVQDVLKSEKITVEGTIEPGKMEIIIKCQKDKMDTLTKEITDGKSTWHVTLAGMETKWIQNLRIPGPTIKLEQNLTSLIVEFDYVI